MPWKPRQCWGFQCAYHRKAPDAKWQPAAGTSTLNDRLGYRFKPRTHVELEGFKLANGRNSAIDCYYVSRLRGESVPVDIIHFHPIESRSFRLNITLNF